MPKQKISEFNSNPALNTDIDSINIAEGCSPSGINDAIRELMSQLKDWQSGTSNDPMVIGSSGSLTLNQGTANGVAYLNGSKVVTSGSALTFDGTNMGLGAASPASLGSSIPTLELKGAITTRTGGLRLRSSDNSVDGYFYADSAGFFIGSGSATDVRFGYGGSEQMRLTSTGLGIGTSSPAVKLQVNSGDIRIVQTNNSANNGLYFRNSADSGTYAKVAYVASTGELQVGTTDAYSLLLQTNNTTKATLDSAGNLGLGVTPSAWSSNYKTMQLGIAGSIYGQTGNTSLVGIGANLYNNGADRYINNAKATLHYQFDGGYYWLTAPSGTAGNAITFTQAMTLDASGNLLVGTTDAAPRNLTSGSGVRIGPSGQLEVAGASDTNYINITAASGTMLEFRKQGPSTVGSISTNGTSTSFNTSSDYRLKNTIAPMTGALDKVAQLKPVTYKWNADGSDGEGFIAHELAEVVPQCVTGEKDAVDENGNPKYQGIDTSFLVATLTAALQEAHGLIKSLEARLDAANL